MLRVGRKIFPSTLCLRSGVVAIALIVGAMVASGPSGLRAETMRVRVRVDEESDRIARAPSAQARGLEQRWRAHGARVGPVLKDRALRAPRSLDPAGRSAFLELSRWYDVWIDGRDLEAWWLEVVSDPSVTGPVVEPPMEVAATTVDDPLVDGQLWFLELIGAPRAWDRVRGEDGDVVIAVVDTGVDVVHPDLVDNLWRNPGEIAGNGIDDDDNGFVDDVFGWNFQKDRPDPTGDPDQDFNRSHGTHVAGIAAARTDNGLGVAGVGFNPRIMAVNVADPERDRLIRYGYDGILYAADNGADVINCSWTTVRVLPGGGPVVSPAFRDFENAVCAYAEARGSVVLAAAGNEGSGDLEPTPAFYPTVLAVAASGFRSESLWPLSNWGPWVDVVAPGASVLSTVSTAIPGIQSPYQANSGTSMATPMVAAAAALLRVRHPDWSPLQVRQRLRGTARALAQLDPSRTGGIGGGLLQVDAAVSDTPTPGLVVGPPTLLDEDADGVVEGGETFGLAFELASPFDYEGSVEIRVRTDDPFVVVNEDVLRIPNLEAGASLQVQRGLLLYAQNATPLSHVARLDFDWSAGGHEGTTSHWVEVLPFTGTVEAATVAMSAAANGKLGYADPLRPVLPSGVGLRAQGALRSSMVFGTLLVGDGPDRVADAVQRALPDDAFEDFRPLQGEALFFETDPSGSGEIRQARMRYSDFASDAPLGIGVEQQLTAWTDPVRGDFVISRWRVDARLEDLRDLRLGILVDWAAAGPEGGETVGMDRARGLQWAGPAAGSGASWAGVVVLEGPGQLSGDWLWTIPPDAEEQDAPDGRPSIYDLDDLSGKPGDDELWSLLARPARDFESEPGNGEEPGAGDRRRRGDRDGSGRPPAR